MSVNTPHITSGLAQVTPQEALASGVLGKRKLDARETKLVSDFIQAHRKAHSTSAHSKAHTAGTAATVPRQAIAAATQVDAKELAAAVALRGSVSASGAKTKNASKHRAVYHTYFTSDASFLERDMESMLKALSTGGKTLCDLSRSLAPHEVALRKYLLMAMIGEEGSLGAVETRNMARQKASILQDHGKFIAKTMAGFDLTLLAMESGVLTNRVGVREYAKAFQVLEDNQQDLANPNSILALFRVLKKSANEQGLQDNIKAFREKLTSALKRESSQQPSQATAYRQHLIASQLNQLRTLGNLVGLHVVYKKVCASMKIDNLPPTLDMVDLCIRIVSGDVASGVTELVRVMASVNTKLTTARNAISATYINSVLKHPVIAGLYRGPAQQLQMVDQLNKNLVAGAVLAAKKSYGS